jgi:hypothetical protein
LAFGIRHWPQLAATATIRRRIRGGHNVAVILDT